MNPVRVLLEHDGDIAVVVIDNPPINAGSAAVREGLLKAVSMLRGDDMLRAGDGIGCAGGGLD